MEEKRGYRSETRGQRLPTERQALKSRSARRIRRKERLKVSTSARPAKGIST
ncbi:MAG: hypothetical protein LBT38_02745 [Deltaproteobacteria bacterium]|nr:hypothetical protein [Deltaproteobacteria bacterium]